MQNTPNSNRINIAIIGSTNAGKSSLLNSITEQEISIVSDVKGTTTDSVKKAMELIPFGPVLFIDTAGLDDETELGKLRIEKAIKEIKKSDFAIYVIDGNNFSERDYKENISFLKKNNIPYVQTTSLEGTIGDLDILYMTRVQQERFFNEEDYLRLKDSYILEPTKLQKAKSDLCIMHPLPRVNEISVAVDDDPRACYFKQVLNGKYMRMALILKLLGEN